MVQTHVAIYTPNGNGSTADYLRESEFDLLLDGSFVKVRRKGIKDARVYDIPMTNVAGLERAPAPVEQKAPVKAA
jgi:hypothetical protein